MIQYRNGGRLVEHISELPWFIGLSEIELLFADFETTSGDDKLDALNPWHHCWAAGVGVTVNEVPGAWYIPTAHKFGYNIPFEIFMEWWFSILSRTKRWINHNVKYDAHVSTNAVGVIPRCELYCSIVQAKIHNSDLQYRGGYGLDNLSLMWLGEGIRPIEARMKILLGKSKDYGSIRASGMAEYGCQDVITNRRLYKYLEQRRPPECDGVATEEIDLTPILFNMEQEGLIVDLTELMLEELEVTSRMLEIEVQLCKKIGRTINPSSRDDVYDVLINQYGLPIVEWTDEDDDGEPIGNASFNKKAMAKYLSHPNAPHDVVNLIAEYRTLHTHRSIFLRKYQDIHTVDPDGSTRLHSSHNQCIRTGRISAKDPNDQALNKRAKKLIHPKHEYAFLSMDQSQIEFRVIAHYINDERIIAAYNDNPDTDFHQLLSESVGIKRDPAKRLNFQNGYGGGKKKCAKELSINLDIIGGVVNRIDQLIADGVLKEEQRKEAQEQACTKLAEKVYDDYHNALPTLKPTSRRATRICADRGYIFNLHGRRRHIPQKHSHIAFNSVCQSEAADIQKERTIAAYQVIKDTPITMVANVHDETLFHGPKEIMADKRVQDALAWILETPNVKLRVPLRVSCGYSDKDWCEASTDVTKGGNSKLHKYDITAINQENPLWFLRNEVCHERATTISS